MSCRVRRCRSCATGLYGICSSCTSKCGVTKRKTSHSLLGFGLSALPCVVYGSTITVAPQPQAAIVQATFSAEVGKQIATLSPRLTPKAISRLAQALAKLINSVARQVSITVFEFQKWTSLVCTRAQSKTVRALARIFRPVLSRPLSL
jgi:hypothetical protein